MAAGEHEEQEERKRGTKRRGGESCDLTNKHRDPESLTGEEWE